MSSRPRVATVLLNHAHPRDTLTAVCAVGASLYRSNSIVVVDNGPDASRDSWLATRLDPTVTYLPTANLGFAAGMDHGIAHARAQSAPELIWVLNPDTRADPAALGHLVEAADAHPDAAAIGARLLSGGRVLSNGAELDPASGAGRHLGKGLREEQLDPATSEGPFDTDVVVGASMLIPSGVLDVLGPLPEEYFLYFEETDFCLRARLRGYRLLVEPRARVTHDQRSVADVPTPVFVYYMVRNRILFTARWGFDPAASGRADEVFVSSCRARVAERGADALLAFDALVDRARADGHAGMWGPSPAPASAAAGPWGDRPEALVAAGEDT